MSKPELLTPRQAQVLMLIETAWEMFRHAPSQRWIATRIGKNVSTINQVVAELEAKGYISREKGKAYGIRLVERHPETIAEKIFQDLRIAIDGCFGGWEKAPPCFQKKVANIEKRYTVGREDIKSND
jgi:SOS-response transcriptional repressor LexA